MNDNKVSSFWTLAFTALSIAVVAVLAVQVFHEASHAVAAVLVGARLEAFNLFGVAHTWTGRANWWGELSIAGNAALMNVLAGLVAVVLFSQSWVRRRPTRRLFLLYVAGYSLLTGFGYLLFDGIFFQPGGQNVGDWKKVLELVGGNWIVRFVVILIGLGGSLWVFFWLPRSALCFGEEMTDQRQRVRLMLRLLMLPYVAINTLFTVLSFWHPLGGDGVIITVMQYWFGYVAFFWAFLIASYWTQATTPPPDTTPLAADFNWRWGVGAAVAVGLAILVLLPTIYFSIVSLNCLDGVGQQLRYAASSIELITLDGEAANEVGNALLSQSSLWLLWNPLLRRADGEKWFESWSKPGPLQCLRE